MILRIAPNTRDQKILKRQDNSIIEYSLSIFRVSEIDNEFLEFYGSLQLCHESKKRQFFDKWRSIDEQPPSQISLGIDPVIPKADVKEVCTCNRF